MKTKKKFKGALEFQSQSSEIPKNVVRKARMKFGTEKKKYRNNFSNGMLRDNNSQDLGTEKKETEVLKGLKE